MLAVAVARLLGTRGAAAAAQELEPIAYVIRIPAPDTHEIVVQATVPASGRASLDLMMPTWSPGYYRVEDYAANVRDVSAETLDGQPLVIEKTNGNHWRVGTRGERAVKLSYRVFWQSTHGDHELRRCRLRRIQRRADVHHARGTEREASCMTCAIEIAARHGRRR